MYILGFSIKFISIFIQKKQKKLSKLTNGNANDDPFGGGDEDDVAKLARELEQKYVRKKNLRENE